MTVDFDRFRLGTFVNQLVDLGEVDVHDEPVRLIDLSRLVESTDKATLFNDAGPQHYQLVAAVCGSRERVAALRVSPLPVVKSLTNDLLVPADAEMVIEGYLPNGEWRLSGD